MKNPSEKFNVDRVERHIPRAKSEKLLISRLFVDPLLVVVGINLENWACRSASGVTSSTIRITKVKTEIDFEIVSEFGSRLCYR